MMSEKLAPKYRYREPGADDDGVIWVVKQHWPGTYGDGVVIEAPSGRKMTVHSSMLVPPEWEAVEEGEEG